MTKKRFLIAIAIVMVLILSVAVFVACNENQTKSYTVKFVDGESEVKSVSVEEGKTIADADVPADLTKDGYVFEGWYVGDVAFDKSAAITADVTYSAKWTKLHTVKFVDGDETIKTATVKDGEKLTDADVPADLTASGKAFEGWFDGTTAFDKDATITADKTFAAKWVGLFNVTFKNGEETIKVAQVKDGAVIAAADIPEDPTDDNYAFIGWFVGETAYDSSAAVTSNIIVSAKFGNINKTLIGTWKGGTLDRSSYTYIHYVLVIGADSIKADLGDGTLVDASNIVWNEDYQTYDFNLAGDTLYSFGEYYGAYSFASADYSVYTNLSKLETGVVSADETALVGTFETKGGLTIEINSTFVTINGVDATEFEYSERDARYTFYIDDASASIEYDSTEGQWFYVVGGEKDQLVIASMAPAAIPEAYFGVWSNATIGEYSVTTITITADGVFDGGYKIGKVASADATSMTVKSPYGDYIFTLGDGTLTMNNGYSDIVLDKNVKVVFIAGEGHQAAIFYVAKVGADGKIDMDSFALEDPTMAAGYTFQGWFGQDDSTIEFDEDATFTQNTIFVSKIEKTGYVLTFKKSSSDSEPVVVVVDKATGKLAANQIPADLTYEDGSVFTGWYTSAGVKAVADLTITQDTTFIAKSVKESDYEGYWLSTASGKEAMLGIDTDAKKLSFLTYTNISYKFENGHIIAQKTGKGYYTIDLFITSNGDIECAYTYFDTIYEEESIEEYVLSKAKAISGVSAGTYRLNKTDYFVINEQGIITTAENGQTTQFGYISGTKTNFTIKYKIGSSSIKTIEGAMVLVGNILCGNYKNDPKMYVYGSESVKDFNCSDDGAHIYEHVVGDKKVYIYTVGGKYSKATITGEVGNGNKITVAYKFYNGESPAVDGSKEYMFVSDTSMVDAGEELGTYTAEGKDSLVLDGFGNATLGEKSYKYSINAKNVVVLTGETSLGVTLDSEAKTYAEATGDGFARSYADANSEYYTVEFDGFGGVNVIYKSKYSTTYVGTYTLGTGTVTVKDAYYSYNKEYTVEESGNVLVSADGSKVLKTAGYVVESKIKSLEGYYVNGDSTIEIVVAEDKTFKLYVDGALVDAKANWNGLAITYSALDADAAIDSAKKQKATFTITKDGDNIKVSHNCAVGLDMDGYIEKAVKEATYTASTKPSAETDGLEGTYKSGTNVIILDGNGNGTLNGVAFTYSGTGSTKQVSAFGAFSGSANTFTVTATGIDVSFDDEYQENTFKASFTKQA
ncbi:MAG: InlB B-repeat-containing protein [Christensenellales bacterium]